jgi:hypothetical protein
MREVQIDVGVFLLLENERRPMRTEHEQPERTLLLAAKEDGRLGNGTSGAHNIGESIVCVSTASSACDGANPAIPRGGDASQRTGD